MGYIYIIKNDINSKVYIGQTIHNVEKRWTAHKCLAGKSNQELYNDMNTFGVNHFWLEILEECPNTKLNEREMYFIRKYNSYYSGYNNTVGGGAVKKYDTIIIDIINDLFIMSIRDLCCKYNVSEQFVRDLRRDIGLDTSINIKYNSRGKQIIMYDTTFENPTLFKTIKEVVRYLSVDRRNFSRNLNRACSYGLTHYNHKWQWADDLICGDKIFRTQFEKEAYLGGMRAYRPKDKKYWVVDNVLNAYIAPTKSIKNSKQNYKPMFCKQCGSKISPTTRTGLCLSCASVKAKNKIPKPSRAQLVNDMYTHSIAEIATKYDRTESTIYYWIKQYDLNK